MVKLKSTIAKAVANQKASNNKSAKSENDLGIPSALRYFWDFAELVWANASAQRVRLAAQRPSLTAEFIADQVAYVATIKALPADDVRRAKTSTKHITLQKERKKVMVQANLLDDAIRFAYQDEPEFIPTQIQEAGITELRKATDSDWAAVSNFLVKAGTYLTDNGAKLVDAGAVTATFATNFNAVGTAFEEAKTAFRDQEKAAGDGTSDVATGVKNIKKALNLVLKLGKTVFESEPLLYKLFVGDVLLDEVRSTHPASLDGRTEWAVTEQRIPGILVEVLGEEGKTATTNKNGRYIIKQLAAGQYTVRFSGPDIDTAELPVTLEPGKGRRLNVQFETVEVEVETPATPPIAPQEPISLSLDSIKEKVDTTNQNGMLHSENGAATA